MAYHTNLCTFLEGALAIVTVDFGFGLSLHRDSDKIGEELTGILCKGGNNLSIRDLSSFL